MASAKSARQAELDALVRDIAVSRERLGQIARRDRCARPGSRFPEPDADRHRQAGPESRIAGRGDGTAPAGLGAERGSHSRILDRTAGCARRSARGAAAHGTSAAAGDSRPAGGRARLGAKRHSPRRGRPGPEERGRQTRPGPSPTRLAQGRNGSGKGTNTERGDRARRGSGTNHAASGGKESSARRVRQRSRREKNPVRRHSRTRRRT